MITSPATIKAALKAHPEVVKRLRKVREFIRKHPKHLDMSDWVTLAGEGKWGSPSCGTTACIAGWYKLTRLNVKGTPLAQMNAGTMLNRDLFPHHEGNLDCLFYTCNWPDPFHDEYHNTYLEKEKADIAAKRITHFLRTGE